MWHGRLQKNTVSLISGENSEHVQSVCTRLSFYFSRESLGTRLLGCAPACRKVMKVKAITAYASAIHFLEGGGVMISQRGNSTPFTALTPFFLLFHRFNKTKSSD